MNDQSFRAKFSNQIYGLIKSSRNGVNVKTLAKKFHVHPNYIFNAIYARTDIAEDDDGTLLLVDWSKSC